MKPWPFDTERLVVRRKAADDAEAFHGSTATTRSCGSPGVAFTTLERTREFVASHMRHQDVHGFSMWALVERSTGTLVGDVGFLA